ncbi:MAG TPA: HPr family phosphocarrier protein [candidate division Zixibacteria bacterium]|nr:HPr family phosphocarrier protein [candidate division Zixibacteria bacterium]
MIEKPLTVTNPLGIHARPAALIVQTASKFGCDITLIKDGRRVNAKSMLGVMTLAAEQGSTVTVVANGADEAEAVAALEAVFRRRFGED